MLQLDELDLTNDIVYKTLWYRGNKYVRKYLLRMIESVIGYSLEDYTLGANELGVVSYKQIANKVDILLFSPNKEHIVEIEMNRALKEKSSKSSIKIAENKSLIYLTNITSNFYNELDEEYKTEIDVKQVNLNAYYCPYDKDVEKLCFELYEKVAKITKKGIKEYDLYLPRIRDLCYNERDENKKDYALLMSRTDEERIKLSKDNKERLETVKLFNSLRKEDDFMAIIDREKYEKILWQNEGKEEGIEQGKKETIIDMIKAMYQNEISIKLIAKSTKMSIKDVKSILELN